MSRHGKRVLMVAFHFPPFAGSSGVQRTLRFAQHLPELGWDVIVLTAHPRAYGTTSDDLLPEVPAGVHVERAFALDTARHLAFAHWYPAALACPDRWVSWRWGAVAAGLRLIERFRPTAIWSTYPIATAHAIGWALQRRSCLPWVADFRDPMVQEGYPADPAIRKSFHRIETAVIRHAARAVFCAPGAARVYAERYPESAGRITVIENGFDERTFAAIAAAAGRAGRLRPGVITLLHSGIVYRSERDPTCLFAALNQLKRTGVLQAGRMLLRFRASSNDAHLRSLARANGVEDIVELAPALSYHDSLIEMMRADGLIVLQGSNCNEQIPAKVYEYLRAGRPLLGLTDPAGDTARLLRRASLDDIVPLDDEQAIVARLGAWVKAIERGLAKLPDQAFVQTNTRADRARELARLLDLTSDRSSYRSGTEVPAGAEGP